MYPAEEPVTIQRTNATVLACVDPKALQLLIVGVADVRAGDVVAFGGYTRRIVEMPEVWNGAGIVATFEDAAPLLPDLGRLLRASGPPVLDEVTGILTPAVLVQIWTGVCSVEPVQSEGLDKELGEQRVGVVTFTVQVPLEVIDPRPDDRFEVTQSRDGRLLVRSLVVTRIRASSAGLVREFAAIDNQG